MGHCPGETAALDHTGPFLRWGCGWSSMLSVCDWASLPGGENGAKFSSTLLFSLEIEETWGGR